MRSLISTAELAAELVGADAPTLLDVRWSLAGTPGIEAHRAGHLPGAVFVDLDTELADPPAGVRGGRHPLPDAERLTATMRRAGVRTGHPVIVYDQDNGSIAARAWWLLRWAGHDRVAVLDGGFAGWVTEARPITQVASTPDPGDFTATPGRMPVIDVDGAVELARAGVLLDARAPARYRGDEEPVDPGAGHVPGARNAPFTGHVGADGRWRSAPELREWFTGHGVDDRHPVGAYCGSGVTACSVVLALELAGLSTSARPAVLYAGSWSEYSADPSRPVVSGDRPG
jgi:thiosulfate/3-mercaptopyruvate sulfurtransferase